ncbi:MAG TPA: GTPase RsgA, partial [Microthrixaceae bacterium]|nr:GTPase RsgA [Microthrixaceae bacterium]
MTDQHDHHAPSLPGWTAEVAASLRSGLIEGRIPGRVVRVDRGEADVATGGDDVMRCRTSTAAKDVVAGDWVAIDPAAERVDAIAPRRTAFVRRAARGAHRPQTLAANADMVAAVHALQPGFSPRRLERELVIIHESGATPIVVLTKADLVDSVERDAAVESATAVSLGAAVVAGDKHVRTGAGKPPPLVGPRATLGLIG